jgi:hypothetical protein
MSEFLREEQGNGQVTQKQNGKNEGSYSNEIHGLPQLLASFDVEKRQAEENCREEQHRHILHRRSLDSDAWRRAADLAVAKLHAQERFSIRVCFSVGRVF